MFGASSGSRVLITVLLAVLSPIASRRVNKQSRLQPEETATPVTPEQQGYPPLVLPDPDIVDPEHQGAPYLVPSMVSSKATIYKCREHSTLGNYFTVTLLQEGSERADQAYLGHDTSPALSRTHPIAKVLDFRGSLKEMYLGKGITNAFDATGKLLFVIKRARQFLNPVEQTFGRFSYRILPPSWQWDGDALFTINRDHIGRGFMFQKEEWRIYKGRQRDNQMLYYCVGSWSGWDTKCFRSEADYDKHPEGPAWDVYGTATGIPLATLSENARTFAALVPTLTLGSILPDDRYLTVKPGEDAALFLAFSVILDMAHDRQLTMSPHVINAGLGLDGGKGDPSRNADSTASDASTHSHTLK